MPIFEYACKCGQEFETLVRAGDEIECPSCQAKDVEKKISMTGKHIWNCSSEGAMPKGGK